MVPIGNLEQPQKRRLGFLKGKARVQFKRDFAIDDESLLSA